MEERILKGALAVFKKRGMKFTMDDLAVELGMSKKTIYTVFTDKNALLNALVDYTFDLIKAKEDAIYSDTSLSTATKLRNILTALPESYKEFDYNRLHLFADKYPEAYLKVQERLESGWDKTREIFEQGVKEGVFRNIDMDVFQLMYESALERMIMEDVLETKGLSYTVTLNKMVDILIDGILQ